MFLVENRGKYLFDRKFPFLYTMSGMKMRIHAWFWMGVLSAMLFTAGCATVDHGQASQTVPGMTLQEWERTHMPTRLG